MKKIIHNFTISHKLANGNVITDEEFMSKPFVVSPELNQEIIEDIKIILMPEHVKQQKQMDQLKKNQQLRERLLMELASLGGDTQNGL